MIVDVSVGPLVSVYRLVLFFPDPSIHSVTFSVDHLGAFVVVLLVVVVVVVLFLVAVVVVVVLIVVVVVCSCSRFSCYNATCAVERPVHY